jgi:hypothetical protein
MFVHQPARLAIPTVGRSEHHMQFVQAAARDTGMIRLKKDFNSASGPSEDVSHKL